MRRQAAVVAICASLALAAASKSQEMSRSKNRAAHIFTGTVSRVLSLPADGALAETSRRYASVVVDRVEKGYLSPQEEATIEYYCGTPDGEATDLPNGCDVRVHCDHNFALCSPNGFEVLSAAEDSEKSAAEDREVSEAEESETIESGHALLALSYLHATRPDVVSALDSRLEGGLTWPEIVAALRANWMSSRFLRERRPLEPPSRRHGLSGVVALTRDVTRKECTWLERGLQAGERFRIYTGHTYGVISPEGVAVQPIDAPHDAPFVELPASALERVLIDP